MAITGVSTPQAVYKWMSGKSLPSQENSHSYYATLLDIDRNNEEYSIVKWRMNQNHLFVRRYEAIEYRNRG